MFDSAFDFQKRNKIIPISHLQGAPVGTTEKDADEILDMEPYQICYLEETKVKKYKYYCEDNINDSIEAYYITVMFNDKNVVNAPVIEEKNDFISDILRPSSE